MSISETSTQVSPRLRPTDSPEKSESDVVQDLSIDDGVQSDGPTRANSSELSSEAPDGGFTAWLQVAAAFFLCFNPWGLVNSFGSFQNYYKQTLDVPSYDVSWTGTAEGFLLLFVGALSGPLYDKGMLKESIAIGMLLGFFGLMMTSLSTQYYQVFLAQGICVGVAMGFLFIPSVSVLSHWFARKRPFAIGIASAGGPIGAIIYSITFSRLEGSIGFGWATRIIGFVVFGSLIFSLAFAKRRVKPNGNVRALFDLNALKSTQFWLVTASLWFIFMGLYFPFFYITQWSEQTLGAAPDFAFYLLAAMNAGSAFGRIVPALLALKFGSLNVLTVFLFITGILEYAWISVDSLATTVLFCIFYGFFSGACITLPFPVLSGIAPDITLVGTWLGMGFSMGSFGLLIGTPIAGAIRDAENGGYVGAQIYGGSCLMVATACLAVLRWLKYKEEKTIMTPI